MTIKSNFAAAVLMSIAVATTNAQQSVGDMKGMDMNSKAPAPKSAGAHSAEGVVKQLDVNGGSVTLSHGPVADLGWPAMTMSFAVKDRALLNKLAPGKKVGFEFVKDGGGYTVTAVK